MANTNPEKWITMQEAAKEVESRFGYVPTLAVMSSWVVKGVGPDGAKIKLQSVKIGGRRLTRASYIESFVRATNPDAQELRASSQ
jgi:hypothetical protein